MLGDGHTVGGKEKGEEVRDSRGGGSDTAQERRLGGGMDSWGTVEGLTDSATAVEITG